jgi:hypothetical protein
MKLIDLHEAIKEKKPGTYVAVKFSDKTVKSFEALIKSYDIPNPTPSDEFHCTVIYSRKHCDGFKPEGELVDPWIGKPTKLEIFKTRQSEKETNCLVIRFDCDKLVKRHEYIMDEYDATYDFPEYKIHTTLSYDCGDFDPASVKDLADEIGKIEIVEEYMEDLRDL